MKRDDKGNLYTHSSYNENIWNRYLTISEHLSVVVREEEQIYSQEGAKSQFEIFNNTNNNVIYIKDIYKSIFSFINPINRIKNNKIIKNSVIKNDCVIARLPSSTGFKAVEIAKKNRIPYICEAVACPWDAYWNHSLRGKLLALFNVFKMKSTFKKAPYALYVTNEFLQRRYPTKGKTVACSNVSLIPSDESVLANRLAKIKKLNEKINLGTVAAVDVRFKGQQYVIRALGKLKKQGITNYEYQIVGGGDQSFLRSEVIKNNVEDQVVFLGAFPHIKVFEWLDTIDIYIQPSRQEGLPRALIEAMSRALPCIGARTGGIPELLESSFIFSNSKSEINEIIKILQSMTPEIMDAQAHRNFDCANEYDRNTIEQRRRNFLKILKTVLYHLIIKYSYIQLTFYDFC